MSETDTGPSSFVMDDAAYGTIKEPEEPEYSEWMCYLFGTGLPVAYVYRPLKGKEPNWFWRKMQYLCFGNRWVKE